MKLNGFTSILWAQAIHANFKQIKPFKTDLLDFVDLIGLFVYTFKMVQPCDKSQKFGLFEGRINHDCSLAPIEQIGRYLATPVKSFVSKFSSTKKSFSTILSNDVGHNHFGHPKHFMLIS